MSFLDDFIKERHLIPIGDYREHEPRRDCWCRPEEVETENDVYIHRPLDNRYEYMSGRLKFH